MSVNSDTDNSVFERLFQTKRKRKNYEQFTFTPKINYQAKTARQPTSPYRVYDTGIASIERHEKKIEQIKELQVI